MIDRISDRKYEIIKIVVEKGMLAIILLLVTYCANKSIENYKAKEDFYKELNKQKVAKISKVWEKAYLLEQELPSFKKFHRDVEKELKGYLENMQSRVASGLEAEKAEKELSAFIEDFRKKNSDEIERLKRHYLDDLVYTLKKNKFWMDKESYKIFLLYSEKVFDLARIRPLAKSGDIKKKADKIIHEIDLLEKNIDDVKEKMFQ